MLPAHSVPSIRHAIRDIHLQSGDADLFTLHPYSNHEIIKMTERDTRLRPIIRLTDSETPNRDHLKIVFDQASIGRWLEENPDGRLDLRYFPSCDWNCQHPDISFENRNLRRAIFRQGTYTGKNFRGAILSDCDFRGANLAGVRLDLADLTNADLRDADLTGADLRGTLLNNANLSGANLRDAMFSTLRMDTRREIEGFSRRVLDETAKEAEAAASFERHKANVRIGRGRLGESFFMPAADLRGARLIEADLTGAYFSGASLAGADFTHAILNGTKFSDVDLSDAMGLEEVTHRRPSTLGIDTIVCSNGKIPEAFLRGCGVPAQFIAYQQSLVTSPIEFYSCFISYSHVDKSFARRLHDALQDQGIRCWLDDHEILPGDDIYRKVDQGLRLWDKVLLCASQNSLSSGWVEREIDTAIERELRLREERDEQVLCIIPLNLDDHLFDWTGSHAAALRKRLAADFRGWESDNNKFEEQFERVVKALRSDDAARTEPPEPKL